MPATFIAADGQARHAQRRYLSLIRAQISLPLVGVFIGAAAKLRHELAPLGVVASGAAVLVAVLRAIQRSSHVETVWYEARATAEDVKSLAWRYAIRGAPFQRTDQSAAEVDEQFIEELEKVAEDREFLEPPDPLGEITDGMRTLRAAPDDQERKDAYIHGRVNVQHAWYAQRSRRNVRVAIRWDAAFYVFIGVAVVAGVLLASNKEFSPWLGPTVSLAAGGSGAAIAWSNVRRYESLARAYRIAATQLSMISALAREKNAPDEWVEFVDDIEGVIMREHGQWRAVRK